MSLYSLGDNTVFGGGLRSLIDSCCSHLCHCYCLMRTWEMAPHLCYHQQWRNQKFHLGGLVSFPSPFLFFFTSPVPFSIFLPSHFLPFFSLLPSFRNRTPKIQLGLEECCELPQRCLRQSRSWYQIRCIIASKYEIWWQQF